MSENEKLEKMTESLWKLFLRIDKKIEMYEDDEKKLASLGTVQQKVSKTIIDCLLVQRDPKLARLSPEDEKRLGKSDLATLVEDYRVTKKRAMNKLKDDRTTRDDPVDAP
ncbi:MAG: hypothetical protein ACRECH_08495 [Nitrososphaerales archaeon]